MEEKQAGMADAGKPSWTSAGTLLLPIITAAWPSLPAQLRLDGVDLHRKRELHVTIVGHALGARVRKAVDANPVLRSAIDAAIAALDWRWQRDRRWSLLERCDEGRRRHSLVEHLRMPAMAAFHRRLGELLGDELPVPPPHVTLHTAGGAMGIGLPDEATLERVRRRMVDAAELPGAAA